MPMTMCRWLFLMLMTITTHQAFAREGDAAARQYAYMLAGARAANDPLSDLVLAHHFRSIARLPRSDRDSAKVRALLDELGREADVMDARASVRLMDDPMLLALRLGPMRHAADSPAQRAAWAERLESLAGDNIYAGMKLMDRSLSDEDIPAFERALKLLIVAQRYDDYRLAVLQAVYARYKDIPGSSRASRATNPLQLALDASSNPTFDLAVNSFACRARNDQMRRLCSIFYRRVLTQAPDPDTALMASIVLQTIGSAEEKAEARDVQRNIDWLLTKFGLLLIGGKPVGLEAHDADRLAHGLFVAHRNVLRVNDAPLTPPEDWVSPNPPPTYNVEPNTEASDVR